MSSYWNLDVTSEALRLREEQVREYVQECQLRRPRKAISPKRPFQLFCWRPALVAPHVSAPAAEQQASL
jgi:hypothetical protein